MKKHLLFFAGLLTVVLLAACGPKGAAPTSLEDTPPNHYLRGMELVDAGNLGEAQTRFARALELDPKYAPGFAGQALLAALNAGALPAGKDREGATDAFRALLDKGYAKAATPAEKFIVAVTGVRAETAAKDARWIQAVEKWDAKGRVIKDVDEGALPYYRNVEALQFFMGKAWFEAGDYAKAKASLGAVVGTDVGKWHRPANDLYARIQKIEQAAANYTVTGVSWAIAAKDSVSRADVAALIVNELNLPKLFGKLSAAEPKADFVPADVSGHAFQVEIVEILKWNVRGLEPTYNATARAELFLPGEPVSRKEMALTLEDILIKVSGDESLATRYFGQDNSPYADVKPTEAHYNAVVNVVTRNLMETDLSGNFRPEDDLDGAELLLAVVRLRNAVNAD
ncbi:S-layer homology domain-containing protein [Pseudodesulfovibrio indicus]|uniref:S-layer family protein n=1 Tax=Pseudodesulfovibrio indicus TaxID=1716143 RepID=A0A126QN95_9BACT|nr:S-layer homology domain-containing protein [Pseudodesulfovibrio indicus]AMK10905.1 hypothetical protein AWY79_07175 [Pseudodesulfovibrio indicus]TDT91897.1 S-layer family protein [Pseudodesulfovibrio indicus]